MNTSSTKFPTACAQISTKGQCFALESNRDKSACVMTRNKIVVQWGLMTRDQVVALRKRLGLKQITLAKMAKIDRSKLSLWECGHVDLAAVELERVNDVLTQELRLIRELQLPRQVTA